jgi:hypothetical protein
VAGAPSRPDAIPGWVTRAPDAIDGFNAVVFAATLTVLGLPLLRVRIPDPPAPPARPRSVSPHWLPERGSAARQPMKDLAEAEHVLAQLVDRLRDAGVAADATEEARSAAAVTADRLRVLATALESVELAAKHARPDDRAALTRGTASLRERLDQGLDEYRGLISAAGQVLLAGAVDIAATPLVEATERLNALAGLSDGTA